MNYPSVVFFIVGFNTGMARRVVLIYLRQVSGNSLSRISALGDGGAVASS